MLCTFQHRPTRVLRQQDFWNKHCSFFFYNLLYSRDTGGLSQAVPLWVCFGNFTISVSNSQLWPVSFLGTQDPWLGPVLKTEGKYQKKKGTPKNTKTAPPNKTPVSLSTLMTSTHVFLVLVQGTVHTVVWSPDSGQQSSRWVKNPQAHPFTLLELWNTWTRHPLTKPTPQMELLIPSENRARWFS